MRGGQSLPGRPYEGPDKRPHMRFNILSLQTMMSSRIHPKARVSHREGVSRIDPSIHDVRLPPPARRRDGNSFFRDRGCGPGCGGVRRDRTDDLMLAKHALYQLSYDPSHKRSAIAGSTLAFEGSRRPVCPPEGHTKCGGPRRTRTADLTLIRRVL